MSTAGWPLRLVEDPALSKAPAHVGDIWYDTEFVEGGPLRLSLRFHAAGRLPLMVRLPCGVDWCVDVCAWKDGRPYGDGWTVTGTAPLITVSPSINLPGIYHGFIAHGVLSADCEGRHFRTQGQGPC